MEDFERLGILARGRECADYTLNKDILLNSLGIDILEIWYNRKFTYVFAYQKFTKKICADPKYAINCPEVRGFLESGGPRAVAVVVRDIYKNETVSGFYSRELKNFNNSEMDKWFAGYPGTRGSFGHTSHGVKMGFAKRMEFRNLPIMGWIKFVHDMGDMAETFLSVLNHISNIGNPKLDDVINLFCGLEDFNRETLKFRNILPSEVCGYIQDAKNRFGVVRLKQLEDMLSMLKPFKNGKFAPATIAEVHADSDVFKIKETGDRFLFRVFLTIKVEEPASEKNFKFAILLGDYEKPKVSPRTLYYISEKIENHFKKGKNLFQALTTENMERLKTSLYDSVCGSLVEIYECGHAFQTFYVKNICNAENVRNFLRGCEM